LDPVTTNPDHYRVLFENEHVRVLDYTDDPGDQTTPHEHPEQRHDHAELVPPSAALS
jgi:beta-alanine degradation protein BauB